jgi:hypothetical protein
MADLSNKELLIPFGTYQDMINRVNKYQAANNGQNPTKVTLDPKNMNDYISYDRLSEMSRRVNDWKARNPRGVLKNVWVKVPSTKPAPAKTSSSSGEVVVNIRGKAHKVKNFTEFYNLMGGYGYSYYYNDILSLQQEIQALTNGKAMNCTDFSQLGVYVAKQFVKSDGKPTYNTRYRHVVCKSGGGHTQFEITGGEFTRWTIVDLAARADKKSKSYPLGTGWCMDGRLRGYNESWVLANKGSK